MLAWLTCDWALHCMCPIAYIKSTPCSQLCLDQHPFAELCYCFYLLATCIQGSVLIASDLLCLLCAAKHLQRASGLAPPSQPSLHASPGPCAMCNAHDIAVPFQAIPCRHLFCYYCLRTNCEADKQFECPLCAVRVSAMQRWYPVQHATGALKDIAA